MEVLLCVPCMTVMDTEKCPYCKNETVTPDVLLESLQKFGKGKCGITVEVNTREFRVYTLT